MSCKAGDVVRCTCSSVTPLIRDADEQQIHFENEGANRKKKTKKKLGYLCAKLLNTEKLKRKCASLTYLLSFFSGGDFLSQPWKMISPPLMFAPGLRFFCGSFFLRLALKVPLIHDGSPVQSAAVGGRLSLLQSAPPIWKSMQGNKVGDGKRRKYLPGAQNHWQVDSESRHGRVKVSRGEETSELMQGEKVSVPAVCFPNSYTTPTAQRDGLLGWTGWRTACR